MSGGGGAQGECYEKAACIATPDFGEMTRQVQKDLRSHLKNYSKIMSNNGKVLIEYLIN